MLLTASGFTAYGTWHESASVSYWTSGSRGRCKNGIFPTVRLVMVKAALGSGVIANVHAFALRLGGFYVRGTKGLRVRNCVFDAIGSGEIGVDT